MNSKFVRRRPKGLPTKDHTYHRRTRLLCPADDVLQRHNRRRIAKATVIVLTGHPNVANLHRRVGQGTPITHLTNTLKDVALSANFHRSDDSQGHKSVSGPHPADVSGIERRRYNINDGGSRAERRERRLEGSRESTCSSHTAYSDESCDSDATVGVPNWGSGDAYRVISYRPEARGPDGRDGRMSKKGDGRVHSRSERGPWKDSYTSYRADGEDHPLDSHCQVELWGEISDSVAPKRQKAPPMWAVIFWNLYNATNS